MFYPLSVLPPWLAVVGMSLPRTHVFEGMRAVIKTGSIPWHELALSTGLNALYFTAAFLFFLAMLSKSQNEGRLAKLGQE